MPEIIAYTCTLIFALGLALWLGSFWRMYKNPAQEALGRGPSGRELIALAAVLVASRIAVYLAAYLLSGSQAGFFEGMGPIWNRGDAPHYLSIAEHGYQAVGEARYFIVFFPLFPWLVRPLGLLLGNYFAAALLVTNAATIGACLLLYCLVLRMYGRETARRSIKYLLLFPAMFFYNAPYTEGLFLLLCVAFFYFLKTGRLGWAALMGMLAAMTRSVGILLVVALLIQIVLQAGQAGAKRTAARLAWTLLVPLGLAVYLFVNYKVTGDAFKFLEYQSDHWQQRLGNPINTIAMIAQNALSGSWESGIVLSIWLPELICIVVFVCALAVSCKKIHPAWGAYALCYFAVAVAPTWLLSAPRYLGTLFPLAAGVALLCKNKWLDLGLTLLLSCGALGYMLMFARNMHVY